MPPQSLSVLQDARELEEHGGARAAVARADETKLAKEFRVVVASDDNALRSLPGKAHADVDHFHRAERRLRLERLLDGRQAEILQLCREVRAGLLDAGRSRWAWAYGHQRAKMLESSRGIKRGAAGSARGARLDRRRIGSAGEQQQQKRGTKGTAGQAHHRPCGCQARAPTGT